MKVYNNKATIEFEWKFAADHKTLRSSVVGGYQGEICNKRLLIYSKSGMIVFVEENLTRRQGMKLAEKTIARKLSFG